MVVSIKLRNCGILMKIFLILEFDRGWCVLFCIVWFLLLLSLKYYFKLFKLINLCLLVFDDSEMSI